MNLKHALSRSLAIRWHRKHATRGLALLAVSGLISLTGVLAGAAAPAGASIWVVNLTASQTTLPAGQATTLTATANNDVTWTPYYIDIFDATTGTLLSECAWGTSCSYTDTQPAATTHSFVAYVAEWDVSSDPPPVIQAKSATSYVTWTGSGDQITLSGPSVTPIGTPGTYTASTNVSITGQGDTIRIDDETTGATLENTCTTSPCTVSLLPSVGGDYLVAFLISNAFLNTPPPHPFAPLASSNVLYTAQNAG